MRRTATTTLAAALLLAVPVGASAQAEQPPAELSVPETIELGEPTEVGFTFVNDADTEIIDATLSMTLQVPGALDEVVAGVEVRSTNDAIDGSTADFEVSAAAVTASVPDDGFTVAAGEQIDSTLVLTFEEAEVDVGYQLEVAIVGERDGETVSGIDFDTFTLVAADEDPADEVERPDRVDAGSGGAAAPSGWLPLAVAGLGAALLLGGTATRRVRGER